MRLVCPNCKANYEIPRQAVPIGGREVKCDSCGHSWFQTRTKKSTDEQLIERVSDEINEVNRSQALGSAWAELETKVLQQEFADEQE